MDAGSRLAEKAGHDRTSATPIPPIFPTISFGQINALEAFGYTHRDLEIMQRGDPEIKKIVLCMLGLLPSTPEFCDKYKLIQGVLYRKGGPTGRKSLLVAPSIIRKDLINEFHDSPLCGHHGRDKTLARLQERFYWKGMYKSVAAYVASCSFCQMHKSQRGPPEGKLFPIEPPNDVFEMWGLDHLGPFKTTEAGNVHIIVAVDYFSRWLEAQAVPSTAAKPVIDFLDGIFDRYGAPKRVVSDRGPAFGSTEFFSFHGSLGHPPFNGKRGTSTNQWTGRTS